MKILPVIIKFPKSPGNCLVISPLFWLSFEDADCIPSCGITHSIYHKSGVPGMILNNFRW